MKDTDLTEVVDAQIAVFSTELPMANVYTYDLAAIPKSFKGPVILLETVGFRVDQTAPARGNMLWVNVEFHAHCMMSRAQGNVAVEIGNMAALIMKIINKNKWGLSNIQPPVQLHAMPGKFQTGPGGFESWVVTWHQTIAIGDTWQSKKFAVDEILISEAPEIGAAHIDSYEVVTDGFNNQSEA
jgi:hypothetical protein